MTQYHSTTRALEADDDGKRRVNQLFIDEKTLLFGNFIPSMNVVPFYPETRFLFSNPAAMKVIGEEMAKIIKRLNVDLIAGCEFAGVPLAAVISQLTGIPVVYIRKKPKEYGSGSAIVGKVSGSRAILIDDASGRGENKHQFAAHLEKENIKVTDVLVIYWTGHPLVPWYQEHNVQHHQLIQFEDLAHYARDMKCISPELHDLIWDWYADYNIERRSLDEKRWQKVFALAKKEGFPIFNEQLPLTDLIAQSKQLGKWIEPPDGKFDYI